MGMSEVEMNVKSDDSFDAGVELINKKFYTQSIHCLYYSVLQLMMYKLAVAKDHPLSYEQQKAKKALFSSSTHDWLFSEIRGRFSGRVRNVFQEDFHFLKQQRIDADYERRVFTDEDSLKCRELSERLRAKLRYIQ